MSARTLTISERIQTLGRCPVFAGVAHDGLALLAEMLETDHYRAGESARCGCWYLRCPAHRKPLGQDNTDIARRRARSSFTRNRIVFQRLTPGGAVCGTLHNISLRIRDCYKVNPK